MAFNHPSGLKQTPIFLYDLFTQEGRHEAVFINLNDGTRAVGGPKEKAGLVLVF